MRLAWGLERPEPVWIKTKKQMRELIELCEKKEVLALDTETTGTDISKDHVIFWSLSTGNDRYFLEADMLREFRPIFQDPDKYWIGSQIKYDFHMCANSGEDIAGNMMCTLTMDRMVDPSQEHGLKEAYEREFSEKMRSFGETFYPKNKKGEFRKPSGKSMQDIILEGWERDPERVIDYASLDAWGVFRLFKRLRKYLKKTRTRRGYTLWQLFLAYEIPMSKVLYQMERDGCMLDLDYLGEIEPMLTKELVGINWKLNRMIGKPINPGSTKQLQKLFYENMRLEPVAWTSGGASGKKAPSLNATALKAHAKEGVQEAKLILKYRGLDKILGTYVVGLMDRVDSKGRIHTTFNQHRADTARLSSSDPNLQNQPKPRKEFDIRKAFIAPPGKKLIVCDYDQLEMYILAHFSGDIGLLKNIHDGKDIHTGNVELVWCEPYDDVAAAKKNKDDTSDRAEYLRKLRDDVKTVGFGLNYGKAANSLARDLKIPQRLRQEHPEWSENKVLAEAKKEAQALIDVYFKRIPGAARFIKGTYKHAARTKYVETYLGRRRWLHQIMDYDEKLDHMREEFERSYGRRELCWCPDCRASREGERQSANTIIQGTAADIVMCAMIKCYYDKWLRRLGVKMLLQIHDELVFECPEEHVEEACEIIQYHMENPGIKLRVPLRAEPGVGDNWVEAK